MEYVFTAGQLRTIGKKVRNNEELSPEDIDVLSEYRKAHQKILSNFRTRISSEIKQSNIIFAQRLKKRSTIIDKLSRDDKTCLTRMHDIAGARLIFKNQSSLNKFRNKFLQSKEKKYQRTNTIDKYNYIKKPKEISGYRGIHDVYTEIIDSPIKTRIEIQYRTDIQHSWATAVEIWDSTTNSETKTRDNNIEVKKFFKLISDMFDVVLENNINKKEIELNLLKQICLLEKRLKILKKLSRVETIETEIPIGTKLEFILLDKQNKNKIQRLFVRDIKKEDIQKIFKYEESASQSDIVLVRTDRKFLKRAYNNYFNDLTLFFENLEKAINKLIFKYPFKSQFIIFTTNLWFLKRKYKQ